MREPCDRALVEGAALAGAQGAPVRGLGRDRADRRAGHRLLERPQAPVRLGPAQAPPAIPPPRYRRCPRTYHDLADAPYSSHARAPGSVPAGDAPARDPGRGGPALDGPGFRLVADP